MPRALPHETDRKFLVYAGTGTDLIFNHGIELPGFASFPLLEHPETRAVQLLLGHTKVDSTVRYLVVELEDALSIAEKIDI